MPAPYVSLMKGLPSRGAGPGFGVSLLRGLAWLGVCCLVCGACGSSANRQTESAHQASPQAATSSNAPPESLPKPDTFAADRPAAELQPDIGNEASQPRPQTASLARIAQVLARIQQEYVDPVEDLKLVSGCKQAMLELTLAASVPEATTTDGAAAALRQITDAFNAFQRQGSTVEDDQLADACIRGMLERLDRRSTFLDRDEFKELLVGSDPIGGVGLELETDAEGVRIIAPIEGAPGDRAGLRPGDVIVEIDQASIQGLELKDVIKRLRGRPDTDVALTVIKKGGSEPRVIALKRTVIQIESVKYKIVDSSYAYVRLVQFQEHTAEKMATALDAMWKQSNGQMKGIILDLRNNSGGLLNASIAVSAAFLAQNALVVYTDGRSKDSKMRLYASSEYYLRRTRQDYLKKLPPAVKTIPMLVLVNGTSAAASEIVAGALQDHKRAKIVGVRTFGQGTIQTIFPLTGDTALKLSTARLFRPSGQPIADAITPDFVAQDAGSGNQVLGSSEDGQLLEGTRLLKGLTQ